MLTHLQIRDFAIIDSVELELRRGLTVLTGETGAGKSILVDALQLLAGGRAGAEVVRHGAERAEVSGDRKSTRLNSSHLVISYAVFCLKKKKKKTRRSHVGIHERSRRHDPVLRNSY